MMSCSKSVVIFRIITYITNFLRSINFTKLILIYSLYIIINAILCKSLYTDIIRDIYMNILNDILIFTSCLSYYTIILTFYFLISVFFFNMILRYDTLKSQIIRLNNKLSILLYELDITKNGDNIIQYSLILTCIFQIIYLIYDIPSMIYINDIYIYIHFILNRMVFMILIYKIINFRYTFKYNRIDTEFMSCPYDSFAIYNESDKTMTTGITTLSFIGFCITVIFFYIIIGLSSNKITMLYGLL